MTTGNWSQKYMNSEIVTSMSASDPDFWMQFAKKHWNRPAHIKEMPPLIDESEIFRALIKASEDFKLNNAARFRLYSGKKNLVEYMGLPQDSDGDLQNYLQRIALPEFCLILNHLQRHCEMTTWFCIRTWLDRLYSVVGIPSGASDIVAFLGNYPETPFGVHYDDANVFIFVITGRKHFLLWPPQFFNPIDFDYDPEMKSLKNLDYTDYAKEAIRINAEAGDIIFIPAHYWHVSVFNTNSSLAISIGLFNNTKPVNLVDRLLLFSASGFKVVPPLREPILLENEDMFKRSYSAKILIMKTKNEKLLLAVNGHLFEHIYCAEIEKLVQFINNKQSAIKLLDIYGEYALPPKKINELLQALYRAQSIEFISFENKNIVYERVPLKRA